MRMILLAMVVVFIVDLSGFTQTWKGWLGRWLGVQVGRVRPLDCSLCMVWWTLFIYLLFDNMSLGHLAWAAILAFCADLMAEAMRVVKELAKMALRLLWSLTDKIH